jgi:hypothetical protein
MKEALVLSHWKRIQQQDTLLDTSTLTHRQLEDWCAIRALPVVGTRPVDSLPVMAPNNGRGLPLFDEEAEQSLKTKMSLWASRARGACTTMTTEDYMRHMMRLD